MASNVRKVADHAGADSWQYDPFGTAVNLHFDIAEVLFAAGEPVPDRWQYHPSMCASGSLEDIAGDDDYGYGASALASALIAGDITTGELIAAGDVMSRYVALLAAAGRDY